MMKNPAMKDMMRGQHKIALDMNYGGLFANMEFTPDELDRKTTSSSREAF